MIYKKVDSKNFDESFIKILKEKGAANTAKGRFDIEPIKMESKLNLIIHLILSLKPILSITYKVLFWEKDDVMNDLLRLAGVQNHNIATSYEKGKLPGVLFIDQEFFEKSFFELLLINHFNYELAKNPSLNIRVQICVNYEREIVLFDIYDDRGFDVYYVESSAVARVPT